MPTSPTRPEPGEGPERGPGRPRDPHLEERALRAALAVFGEKGWAGMTMDEVAARARVGKSSLYLRWPDKAGLLTQALAEVQRGLYGEIDGPPDEPAAQEAEPTLRDYLVAHANRRARLFIGEHGLAMLRLYAEARAHPDVFAQIREQAFTTFVIEERHRVEAAIRSGELPPTASPIRILDAVEGSVLMHILVTPPALVGRVKAGLSAYVETMVDDQLRAAGCTGVPYAQARREQQSARAGHPSRKLTPNPPRG